MDSQLKGTMKPITPDWRKRLELGAARLPLQQRMRLMERLIIVHESFDEIMASWDAEIARRIDDYDSGRTEGIPAEVVFAEMRAIIRRAPKTHKPPPVPSTYREIKDQALRLPHGDFYLLLTSLEAALPADVGPHGVRTSSAGSRPSPRRSSGETDTTTATGETMTMGRMRRAPRTDRIVFLHPIRYLPRSRSRGAGPHTIG
jgi:putative addiction module component (TIGR02574 family)